MDRRQALQTMAGAAGSALLPAMPAHAQPYPARPVRWLVPFPPAAPWTRWFVPSPRVCKAGSANP